MHQRKKTSLGENNKSHVNKMLRKAIMKRSKLKNKANKTKLPVDINNYKKQRNYVVNLNKSAKFGYFNRYDCKDGKPFWVTCKPYFSNKHSKADNNIVLNENRELMLKSKEIADTFNNHFGSIVDNLNLQHWNESSDMPSLAVRSKDLNYIVNKYRNHPSIKTIKENFPNVKKFAFQLVSTEDVKKVIKDLKTNKSVRGEIPTQILKESEFTFETLKNCINQSLKTTGEFPGSLNLTPIYKNDDPLDKSNYRPVSILPLLSKVYERIIYKQLSQHAEQFLNKILCGFRKTRKYPRCTLQTSPVMAKRIRLWRFCRDNFNGLIKSL